MNTRLENEQVRLPATSAVAECRRTATDLFFEVAWELGEFYDERLRPVLGDDWVAEISSLRGERRPFALHDPVFALKEPSQYSDSRIRLCLPKEGRAELLDAMDDLLRLRNGWIHASILPDLNALERVASTARRVALPLDLGVAGAAARVIERIDALRRGNTFEADELDTLRARATEAERIAAEISADAEASRRELHAALAARDEALAAVALAEKRAEPPPTLPPGSRWDYPRGSAVLRLTRFGDVIDPTTLNPYDAPDGRTSRELGTAWLRIVPAGGDVWVDEFGNVTCHVAEHFVLLDNVSGAPHVVSPGDPAPGFLLPGEFVLRPSGEITDRDTGSTLAAKHPADARHVADRLLAFLPSGGKLARTTTGHIVSDIDDRWIVVSHVTDDEWF